MSTTRRTSTGPRATRRAAPLVVALGGLVLLGPACSKDATTTTSATTPTTAAAGASTTAAPGTTAKAAADPASTVNVKLFMFKPSPLTVKAGTTVTWTNEDDTVHEPTSGTETAPTKDFDVELDGKGSSGTHTFEKPGTYEYFCQVHTSMKGQIVVT